MYDDGFDIWFDIVLEEYISDSFYEKYWIEKNIPLLTMLLDRFFKDGLSPKEAASLVERYRVFMCSDSEKSIGDVFTVGDVTLKVFKSDGSCVGCFYSDKGMLCLEEEVFTGTCVDIERGDSESVIFKKVD